jgi:hypothetical protein
LSHREAEVEGRDMNQLPLQNVLPTAYMASSQPSSFVAVGEAALN